MDPDGRARPATMPIRDRVAVALNAAERVMPVLALQPYTAKLLGPALADARRWQRGGAVPAGRLYGHIHPLREAAEDDELAGRELAACCAVVYALYYATWQARREEGPVGRPLPNDICDITEDTLGECLAYAARVEASAEPDAAADRPRD